MLNPFVKGYVEQAIGLRPEDRENYEDIMAEQEAEFDLETPLYERSESEQQDLFNKIEALIAERRRLTRDMLRSEDDTVSEQQFTMKKVGTRYLAIPLSPSVPHVTHHEASAKVSLERLDEIKDELYDMGRIPSLHEAYERKLTRFYYMAKMVRSYERMRERLGEVDTLLEQLYEKAGTRRGGAVAGRYLKQAELLETEKIDLARKIDLFEGNDPEFLTLTQEMKEITDWIKLLKANQIKKEDLAVAVDKIRENITDLKSKEEHSEEQVAELESQLAQTEQELQFLETALEHYDQDITEQTERKTAVKSKLESTESVRAAADYVYRSHQLRGYAEDAARERMVMIPSTEKLTKEGLEQLNARQPFLLSGHLGAGKTEVARHIAKTFMLNHGVGYDPQTEDPDKVYDRLQVEIFSGAEDSTVYDLIGKLKLTGKSADDPAYVAEHAHKVWKKLQNTGYSDISEAEIVKLIIGKSDVTETIFTYGPLGRALKEGKPIIIDEVNMIPPEVLGRLNDILLTPVGKKVALQENGPDVMEIKPGFAVLGTCNFGGIYAGTRIMNAAFKSRWVMREVDYPAVEETYDLILASLVQKDRLRFPPKFPADQFDTLARLAIVVNEAQELFSGKTEGRRFMALSQSAGAERSALEQNVISTRDLMRKIVTPWKASNFTKSPEAIIASNILATAADHPDDQKFLTELFLRRGFFKGWKEADFRSAGVQNVSQREINALTAAMDTDDYKQADSAFGELLETASKNMKVLKQNLMLEVQPN
jgi:MoxR-like ATPase